MSTSLTKAQIVNLDTRDKVQCLFNPAEYTFTKQNTWTREANGGANVPHLEFGGGQPATLQMQIYFDTYRDARDGKAKDVRKDTDRLWKMMLVSDKNQDRKSHKGRPPKVQFRWGKTWSFDAVLTSMTQKFILFLPDGTPVRAVVDLTFMEVRDTKRLKPQNPTSAGDGGEQVWTVRVGDNLPLIAYAIYGDTGRWPAIAEANRLDRVRDLRPGTVLILPTL